MNPVSFRGSFERFSLGGTWPFSTGRLTVSESTIQITGLMRRKQVLTREALRSIRARRIRVPPFVWRTLIEIEYSSEKEVIKTILVPFAGTQTVEALREGGWLIE